MATLSSSLYSITNCISYPTWPLGTSDEFGLGLVFILVSVSRIMEDRKGQENFQLIVITHDERFAQLIGQKQHAERYYRVTKDDQ